MAITSDLQSEDPVSITGSSTKKFFDILRSHGKGGDNTAKGSRKIAQSIVESNVILGVVENKTLICAQKELIGIISYPIAGGQEKRDKSERIN